MKLKLEYKIIETTKPLKTVKPDNFLLLPTKDMHYIEFLEERLVSNKINYALIQIDSVISLEGDSVSEFAGYTLQRIGNVSMENLEEAMRAKR